MATTTPLTDAINSLTTYSNSVTGASDTDLSSAVATLVAGYGGGGGASNVVTGTFTGTTAGSAMSVSLDYTGNGYPIVVLIYPVDGVYNSSSAYYSLVQRYAVGSFCILKNYPATSPTYTGSGDANKAFHQILYKSSASYADTYSRVGNLNGTNYNSDSATDSYGSCVRINSATQLSVFIADTSYGFAANIAYKYWVIYSE